MATIGDAMVTLLTTNWAGAGAAPTFGHLVDYQKDLADTTEQVIVRLPVHEDVNPINDTYSNFKYTIQIRVKSTVSDDRLKILADETIRIINTYAITGITRQFAKRGENTSDRTRQVFSYDVWAILEEHMSTAGTSYSSPGAGDVTFPADVTVTDDLITDNIISANPINIRPSGNIVDYLEFDTVGGHPIITGVGGGILQIRADSASIRLQPSGDYTDYVEFTTTSNIPKIASRGASDLQLATDTQIIGVDQIADLLMFGSANAAWVPCIFMLESAAHPTKLYGQSFRLTNADLTDLTHLYELPLPTSKGGLKLYVDDLMVSVADADATNYVDIAYVVLTRYDAQSQILADGTNRTAADDYTYAIAPTDTSAYTAVRIQLVLFCTDVEALDIDSVRLKCYYAA